ncbi:hypothetical protein C9I98_14455 [Photobacterium sanctipauli]|uniref:Uncharacterized protein n=1 Tax=Photobacterium sanctipauli TaxID=1342794 RepID=A0A2T3NR31_9GAMM|nr:hypothetical protein [Photobacterium sanctipauli]PSW18677.1 hypothetical protein C9I98_14455 [Photobacterium sanctipauli]
MSNTLSLKDVLMKEALCKAVADLLVITANAKDAQLRVLGVHEANDSNGKDVSVIELAPIVSIDGKEDWSGIKPMTPYGEDANTLYLLVAPAFAKDLAMYIDHMYVKELTSLDGALKNMDEANVAQLMRSSFESVQGNRNQEASII